MTLAKRAVAYPNVEITSVIKLLENAKAVYLASGDTTVKIIAIYRIVLVPNVIKQQVVVWLVLLVILEVPVETGVTYLTVLMCNVTS